VVVLPGQQDGRRAAIVGVDRPQEVDSVMLAEAVIDEADVVRAPPDEFQRLLVRGRPRQLKLARSDFREQISG
jgi:hypothetical protein